MTTDSLAFWPAVKQVAAFTTGDVSPVEVLKAQQDMAERFNPVINAFTERMDDEALHGARSAEGQYLSSKDRDGLPPLLGVTVAVKASHEIAGHAVEDGASSDRKPIARADHPAVKLLRDAGALLLGRTTTPEFNCATVTHSLQWGVTRNPWNLQYSPGGSSGGSAAAIAAGMSTLATASDIAGSIRIPASFSGLVGFKPPWGWVPGTGPMSLDRYLVHGGLARSVADSVLLTRTMSSGPQVHDMPTPPSQERRSTEQVRPLRVAVSRDLGGYKVDADVEATLLQTAEQLTALGHHVEFVDIELDPAEVHAASFAHFGHIFLRARKLELRAPETISPYTRSFIGESRRYAGDIPYYESMVLEFEIQRALLSVFDDYDILLCPTSGISGLPADGNFVDGLELGNGEVGHYWRRHLTLPFNIASSLPVVAVPNGFGDGGIPTSVQVAALRSEHLVEVATQIEELNPISIPALV